MHRLATAIVSLAHSMGLETVAEGVESSAQWAALRETGCERIHGFLFSPSVPYEKLAETLGRIEAVAQGPNTKSDTVVLAAPVNAPGKVSSAALPVLSASADLS